MKSVIKTIKDDSARLKLSTAFSKLAKQDVFVGVPRDETHRKEDTEVTNATLAYIHNNGSPAQNIPARPFMEPGIEQAKDKITGLMAKGAKDALEKGNANEEVVLNKVGLVAQASIRGVINEGVKPELAPGTIRARQLKGFKGTKPLVRTGQLRNSINYVLRKKNG